MREHEWEALRHLIEDIYEREIELAKLTREKALRILGEKPQATPDRKDDHAAK